MPYLAGITLYPIKSLDPVPVPSARIVENGGLEHDREFAFYDADGKVINGKRTPKVHRLSARIDWKDGAIFLETRDTGERRCFHLQEDRSALEAWLSAYFDMPVTVRRSTLGGFPDDLKAPGPTVIGRETLETVASWYEGVSAPEAAVRFRANLEIADAPAFWEDRLYGAADEIVRFRIGDVQFEGANPCQRCIVPTRDTRSGEQTPDFANRFRERREATLPAWASRDRFNHFYRLAVNTRVPASEAGKVLRVGDEIRLA
jgi:uncharacterized protein YcbX